ncbi:O-antigen ligase family protein [Vibrio pelagius]|uniref:O-antigen ligase family protein n=1 Tax=Vibrio pelagius TaxID=28169 RepID=A0ABY5G2G2_VIBPE|nr:O-antigen ligase family protein [Vibrio pelagius]UTT84072.1 O-antigen ligase family protein [Vibrio pelagius]
MKNTFISGKSNKIINIIMLLPILWSFSAMLLYPDAKKHIVIVTILSSLVGLFAYGFKQIRENLIDNKILWIMVALLTASFIAKEYYGYSSSLIRAYAVLFLVFSLTPKAIILKIKNNIHYLILTGSVFSFGYTYTQTFIQELGRGWSINPIPYTTISASLAVASLCILFFNKESRINTLMFISFTLSFNPLIFGQTRGTALAFIIASLALVVYCYLMKKEIKSKLIITSVIIMSSLAINSSLIEHRVETTKIESGLIENGQLESSIGQRLQMWKAGLILIKDNPIWGHGDNHNSLKNTMAESGIISQSVVHYTHYHNQYIDSFAKYGVLGFSLVMIIYLMPFIMAYKSKSAPSITFVFVGLVFIVASLTDVPMSHAQSVIIYFILMFILNSNEAKKCK